LAIFIACLGLLGMISNKVVEKTKEIGIRKVMGAQLYQIAQILLSTTVKQIVIATIIGIPVAYYLTQQYLEKYSERIALQWWHFALPVVILVTIMFLTISSVLWKAAKNNPVDALKYE
jgi:putative ABC transport system permease protein